MNAACVSDVFVHILFKYVRQRFHNVSSVLSQVDVEFDMSNMSLLWLAGSGGRDVQLPFFFFLCQ